MRREADKYLDAPFYTMMVLVGCVVDAWRSNARELLVSTYGSFRARDVVPRSTVGKYTYLRVKRLTIHLQHYPRATLLVSRSDGCLSGNTAVSAAWCCCHEHRRPRRVVSRETDSSRPRLVVSTPDDERRYILLYRASIVSNVGVDVEGW